MLAIAAAAVGIDDNLPGVLLAFLAATAFVIAFVHPWRTAKEFVLLLLASVLGFVLFLAEKPEAEGYQAFLPQRDGVESEKPPCHDVGLTGEFKQRYFEIPESSRGASQVDVEAVVRELYGIPNSRGRSTLQYSFVTKLAHTANPSYPIYDALVARVFGFRPTYYGEIETRQRRLCDLYVQLADTYAEWKSSSRMQSIISDFHRTYGTDHVIVSDTKFIDFLVWSAGRIPALCS